MTRTIDRWLWKLFKRPRPTQEMRALTNNENRIRLRRQAYYRRLREIRNEGLRAELNDRRTA